MFRNVSVGMGIRRRPCGKARGRHAVRHGIGPRNIRRGLGGDKRRGRICGPLPAGSPIEDSRLKRGSRPPMTHRSHLRSHLLRAAALAAITLAGCSSERGSPRARAGAGGPVNGFEATRRDPPIAADTRFAAGQLAESGGAFVQAAEQYRQALKLDPKHADSMFHLGVVLANMKKYPDAIDVWKKYLKLTGESPRAYSNLGFCYELAGRPEDAEAAYQKGIRKDPASIACHVNYGLMLVRRGRAGEGKLQLGAVLKP